MYLSRLLWSYCEGNLPKRHNRILLRGAPTFLVDTTCCLRFHALSSRTSYFLRLNCYLSVSNDFRSCPSQNRRLESGNKAQHTSRSRVDSNSWLEPITEYRTFDTWLSLKTLCTFVQYTVFQFSFSCQWSPLDFWINKCLFHVSYPQV